MPYNRVVVEGCLQSYRPFVRLGMCNLHALLSLNARIERSLYCSVPAFLI